VKEKLSQRPLLAWLIRTVAAAAFATVTTLQQKLAGENEEAVLDVVVEACLQLLVVSHWRMISFLRVVARFWLTCFHSALSP
jgi:hypothetical protein